MPFSALKMGFIPGNKQVIFRCFFDKKGEKAHYFIISE